VAVRAVAKLNCSWPLSASLLTPPAVVIRHDYCLYRLLTTGELFVCLSGSSGLPGCLAVCLFFCLFVWLSVFRRLVVGATVLSGRLVAINRSGLNLLRTIAISHAVANSDFSVSWFF